MASQQGSIATLGDPKLTLPAWPYTMMLRHAANSHISSNLGRPLTTFQTVRTVTAAIEDSEAWWSIDRLASHLAVIRAPRLGLR